MSYATYSNKRAIRLPRENRQQKCFRCSMDFRDKHQHCSKRGHSFPFHLLQTQWLRDLLFSSSPSAVLGPALSPPHFCVVSIFYTFTVTQGTVQLQLHLVSTLIYILGNNPSYKHNIALPFCLSL